MEAMVNFKIEGFKEGLTKLLEERLSSDDKEICENNVEGKRNMNKCNMTYQNYKSKCTEFHFRKEQQKMKWKF